MIVVPIIMDVIVTDIINDVYDESVFLFLMKIALSACNNLLLKAGSF